MHLWKLADEAGICHGPHVVSPIDPARHYIGVRPLILHLDGGCWLLRPLLAAAGCCLLMLTAAGRCLLLLPADGNRLL